MAEANQYIFDYKEVAEALVKQQDIHEGIWGLYIEFAFGAANINTEAAASVLTPSAIASVKKIGIQRFPEENNLTVNAAVVNPPKQDASKSSNKKSG